MTCSEVIEREVARYIEAELRAYPEVRWDRFIEYGGRIAVYGWLGRDDGRSDFLLLDFDAATGRLVEWITSAHPHPASVVERLEGDESVECQRVEDNFNVPNAVRLAAANLLEAGEARTEYRVVGDSFGVPMEATMPTRPAAGRLAKAWRGCGSTNVHIQSRQVTETPWTDLEEGTSLPGEERK